MEHKLGNLSIGTANWTERALLIKAECLQCGYVRGVGKIIGDNEWTPEDTKPMVESLSAFFAEEECYPPIFSSIPAYEEYQLGEANYDPYEEAYGPE